MLHILLMILKIIGIIILVILGLLLLAVLSFVFVPVRYQAAVKYYDDLGAHAKVHWLLYLIYLKAEYIPKNENGEFVHVVVRILGIVFYDNLNPQRGVSGLLNRRNEKKSTEHNKTKRNKTENNDTEQTHEPEIKSLPEPSPQVKELPQDQSVDKQKEPDEKVEPTAEPHIKKISEKEKKSGKTHTFFEKIKDTVYTVIDKIKSIYGFIAGIPARIRHLKASAGKKIRYITSKKDAILTILMDENNKSSFDKIKKMALKILKHVRPTRLKAKVYFGFDDPASTGYTLGLLSLLYPVYMDNIKLYPDFERQLIKGECLCRGRLAARVFIAVVIQLVFDKNYRRILKSFKNI